MNSKIVSTITTSSIFLTIVPIVVGTITALSSLLFMIGVENVQAQLIDEIPVGDAPTGIAHDPVNGHMYVTNQADDTVHVIDTTTNEVIGEIPVGDAPTGIALDSVNGQMYVTNQHDNTVHVIDINNGGTPPGETANLLVTPGVLCLGFGDNDFCTQLETTITEDQFSISVAGNSPMPSQFLGSEAGQNVELGAGDFTVTLIPLPSVADDVAFLEEGVDEEDVDVQFLGAEFSEACSEIAQGSFTATGNIAAGQSETCKIVTVFGISPPDDPDD